MNIFARRRRAMLKKIGHEGMALIFPTHLDHSNALPYRQGSSFYYLSGFAEPDAVMVLAPGRPEGEYLLFCRPRDPGKEQWDGLRAGIDGAQRDFGADEARSIDTLDESLPLLLQERQRLFYTFGQDARFDTRLLAALQTLRGRTRAGIAPPSEIIDVDRLIDEMRLIKSPEEIALMQKAADITADAHGAAMQYCRPGRYEYEVEAVFWKKFREQRALPAYASIVAGGRSSCVLHYSENSQQLRDGDLLLIDAGAEFDYYAADITRTFPVNGRFSGEQRAIYELVLAAQTAVIEMISPGLPFDRIHARAVEVLTQGLVDLGILRGSVQTLIEQGVLAAQIKAGQSALPFVRQGYFPFYMHQTSHWLGLNVHDVGAYKLDRQWRPLKANMVLTVEPGLYIPPRREVPERWHGIGVRIEDDVCVTAQGCRVLTSRAPKSVTEIEALMSESV